MKPLYIGDDAESQRQQLSTVGRYLCRRGRLPGTSGSVSVRSGEAILITAGDLDKRAMTPQETVMVDPSEGLPLTGEIEWPPEETAIHLALYRRLPGCGAVIHVQAPCSMALAFLTEGSACLGRAVLVTPETVQTLDPSGDCLPALPVVADRLDASRIAEDVVAALDASAAGIPPALLIQPNGLVVWGRDTDEAVSRLECVEQLGHLLRPGAVADEPAAAR